MEHSDAPLAKTFLTAKASQSAANRAWAQGFSDGAQESIIKNSNRYPVRAVRAF